MRHRLRQAALPAILAFIALLAWLPRSVEGLAHPYTREGSEWFSRDPDGLYHARRVERALREGAVAERDPRMNFPEGAAIPWPPYYDLALATALAPFAPDEPDTRWRWIESTTASAPRLFGVLAALVATLAGWWLGGATAALVAGVGVALCRGTINYSVLGTGDHHAWVSLLAAMALLALSRALRPESLGTIRRSAAWGALIGILCGALIGSWVASLLYVLELQLVLGWMLWRRARTPMEGLATLGLSLHLTAALTLLPAVLSSPWRAEFPWMVVNLSWFHLAELALGALVFVPLALPALASGRGLAKAYPALVAAALALLAGACWALELAPARGIAAGFEWVSRVDTFMDTVQESMPLVGARAEPGVLFLALGYSVLAVPLALGWAAWRVVKHGEDELAPWLFATAALLPQALQQRRFADALAVPMAVLLGWAAARIARRFSRAWIGAMLVAVALASQYPSASSAWRRLTSERDPQVGSDRDIALGEREALEWLRTNSSGDDTWSVLSHWDRGHAIEWVADAPSVATNFGSYIGVESYRDPARFFLSEDPERARELLRARRVRYVWAPSGLMNLVPSMCRIASSGLHDAFLRPNPQGGLALTDRWFGTLGARLLFQGCAATPTGFPIGPDPGPLRFLRLVHVSRRRDPRFPEPVTGLLLPVGFVWEHVEGARVEAHGDPGDVLELEVDVRFATASYRLPWRTRAVAGSDGIARATIPYCTSEPNGEGVPDKPRWRMGARGGALEVPESAVRLGETVTLP